MRNWILYKSSPPPIGEKEAEGGGCEGPPYQYQGGFKPCCYLMKVSDDLISNGVQSVRTPHSR